MQLLCVCVSAWGAHEIIGTVHDATWCHPRWAYIIHTQMRVDIAMQDLNFILYSEWK